MSLLGWFGLVAATTRSSGRLSLVLYLVLTACGPAGVGVGGPGLFS
jgi:hypothetical protein